MHILAPLAIVLLLSGCLYKTKEVWNNDNYKLMMSLKFGKTLEDNERQLRVAVAQGLILPEYAEHVLKMKAGGAYDEFAAQRFIDLAVDETRRQVAQSKIGAGQSAVQYV